jgi:hypothetical protein
MGICWSRRSEYHPCILVGNVVRGEPVAYFNRRVIAIRFKTCSAEEGTYRGVKDGKGRIKNVELLGRVTVLREEQLSIARHWIEQALKETGGRGNEEMVFEGLRAEISASTSPMPGEETVELDIFRAEIVNHSEDQIFVYRRPSSFP